MLTGRFFKCIGMPIIIGTHIMAIRETLDLTHHYRIEISSRGYCRLFNGASEAVASAHLNDEQVATLRSAAPFLGMFFSSLENHARNQGVSMIRSQMLEVLGLGNLVDAVDELRADVNRLENAV